MLVECLRVCVKTMQMYDHLWLICSLINVNVKHSGSAAVNAFIAGEGVNVCVCPEGL